VGQTDFCRKPITNGREGGVSVNSSRYFKLEEKTERKGGRRELLGGGEDRDEENSMKGRSVMEVLKGEKSEGGKEGSGSKSPLWVASTG